MQPIPFVQSMQRQRTPDMTAPIVINIHGAKLLSKELSKNARIHPLKKARVVKRHRVGANAKTVAAIVHKVPRMRPKSLPNGLVALTYDGNPISVRSVTLARICPTRYFADSGDNANNILSPIRDGVADALGVNDKVFVDNPTELDIQNGKIGIRYEQIDGPWGVRITIEPA